MANPLGVLAQAVARWLRGYGAVCTDGAARTMNQFDVVQGFLECGETRSPSHDRLVAEFLVAMQALGFRHFACCSHVDSFHPPPEAVMPGNVSPGSRQSDATSLTGTK